MLLDPPERGPAPATARRRRRPRGTEPVFPCLIVTGDRHDRDRLRGSLGCDRRFTCTAPASHAELAGAAPAGYGIVFVDLRTLIGGWLAAARRLVAARAGHHATLVVVCGNDDDGAEERWARSLGVSLYVPGLPLVDVANQVLAALLH